MKSVTTSGRWQVPWIEALPESWDLMSAKRLFQTRSDLASVDEPQLAATQAYGVIEQAEYERRVGRKVTKLNKNLDKRRLVKRDDFIISMRSFEGGLERAWAEGGIRSSYIVLRPAAEISVGYYQHLFKSQPYIQALRATGNFIRDGQDLNFSNFALVDLPYPPPEDQTLIARYLDWHGAMTGKLIRAKRRLIALLNEQKQSIIRRAVTRGLDPAATLKTSGVDWLGDVPEHWEVKRLKFACQVNPRTSTPSADVQVTFLPMENVGITGQVDYSVLRETAEVSTGYTPFQQGDVILAKITPCFENGKGALLCNMPTAIGYGSTEFIVLRPMPGLLADYVYLLTVDPAFRLRGTEAMTGSAGQQRVSSDFVANWIIALPPEAEQCAICAYVRDHTAEFDAAIHKVQSEIKLIQEFRTRLIFDVVTGQLDVLAVAVTLPDVAEAYATDLTEDDDLDDDVDDLIDEEEAA